MLNSYGTSLHDYSDQIGVELTITVVYPVLLELDRSYTYKLAMSTASVSISDPVYVDFRESDSTQFIACRWDLGLNLGGKLVWLRTKEETLSNSYRSTPVAV